MTWYADLSNKCQVDHGPHVRAIGWLSAQQPFPTGEVDTATLKLLMDHIENAWQPVAAAGPHFCEFCHKPGDSGPLFGGSQNVWIPSVNVVYVAPQLITHYIEIHKYLPPAEFTSAVKACPRQKSKEYFEMLKNFDAWWIEFINYENT